MNYFKLAWDIDEASKYHLDKHAVKMPTEYTQLLCTAHRVLDGDMYIDKTANNRSIKRWRMEDPELEDILYKASHINHPTARWVRESVENYNELYKAWLSLCKEYTHRYGKTHLTKTKLECILKTPPKNIPNVPGTPVPQAMPDDVKQESVVEAYRAYYRKYKAGFAKWTNRETPEWFYAN